MTQAVYFLRLATLAVSNSAVHSAEIVSCGFGACALASERSVRSGAISSNLRLFISQKCQLKSSPHSGTREGKKERVIEH